MKIIHIITGLGNGGAENTLYKICKYDDLNDHVVISLKKPEKYYSLLKKLGIRVYCLDFKIYSIVKFILLIPPDAVNDEVSYVIVDAAPAV